MDLFLDAVGDTVLKLFDEDGQKKRPALRMTQKNHRYRSQSPPGIRKQHNSSSLQQRGRALTRSGGGADTETESSESTETTSIAGTFATRTTATSFAGKTTGTSVAQSTLGSVEGLWLKHQRTTSVTRTDSFHHTNGSVSHRSGSVGDTHSQYSGAASTTLRRQSTSRGGGGGGGGGGSRSSRGSGSERSDSRRPHMVDSYHSNETPRKSNEHNNRGSGGGDGGLEPLPGRRDMHEKNADYAPHVEALSKTMTRVDLTLPRKEFRSYTQLQPPPPPSNNNNTQLARSTSAPPYRSRQVQWPGAVEPTQGLLATTTTSSGLQGGASRSTTPLVRQSSRAAAAVAPTAPEPTIRPIHGNNSALRRANSTNSASTFGPQPEANSAEQQQQQPPARATSRHHSHGGASAASTLQQYGHAVQSTRHGGGVGSVANSVQGTSHGGGVGSVANSLQQYGHPVQSTTGHAGGFSSAVSSLQQYGHPIQSARTFPQPVNRQLSRLTEADVETDRDDSVREEDEDHINILLARVRAAEEKGLLYLQELQTLRLAVKQWEQHGTDEWLKSKSQGQQPVAYPAPAHHDVRAYPPPRVAHDDSVRAYPPGIDHDDLVRVRERDFEPRYDELDSTCVNPMPDWLKSCGCLAHHNISQPATRAYRLGLPHEYDDDVDNVRGLQYLPNGTARHDNSHHAMTMMPPPDHLMMPQLESSNYPPRMRPQEDLRPYEMATTRSNDFYREVAQPEHHHGQRQQQHHLQGGGGGESSRHHVPRSKVLPAGAGASSASSRSDSYYGNRSLLSASASSQILRGGPPVIPSAAALSNNGRSAMARPHAPPTMQQQNSLEGRTIVIYPGPTQEQLETGTAISSVHDHSNPYYVM